MIRRATPADLDDLASLEQVLFGPDAWSAEQLAEELTGVGRAGLVADAEGVDGIAGYVVTMLIGDVADLQRIGVRPDCQRQGIAGALLEAALERPAQRMLLEVAATNAGAQAFYARHGFVEIARRRGYYRDGTDAIVLERPVPAGA